MWFKKKTTTNYDTTLYADNRNHENTSDRKRHRNSIKHLFQKQVNDTCMEHASSPTYMKSSHFVPISLKNTCQLLALKLFPRWKAHVFRPLNVTNCMVTWSISYNMTFMCVYIYKIYIYILHFKELQNILSWKDPTRIMKSNSEVSGLYGDQTHNLDIINTML